MPITPDVATVFKSLNITSGADLEEYCMKDPDKEAITKSHGEGLASLYKKALGSISCEMINGLIPGDLDTEDRLHAARFNLYLVGMISVDGRKTRMADYLGAADMFPGQVVEVATMLWEHSGLHEVTQRAGLHDDSISDEEYATNLLALLEAEEAYPE